jgi:hypothetical protein
MKRGSVTVQIQHQAGMAAANTVNAKHRGLVDCNAFQGSTFEHRHTPKNQNPKAIARQIRPSSYL